jgi:hypothetical protein
MWGSANASIGTFEFQEPGSEAGFKFILVYVQLDGIVFINCQCRILN